MADRHPVRATALLVGGMALAWSLVVVRAPADAQPPGSHAPAHQSAHDPMAVRSVRGADALDAACRRQQGRGSSAVYLARTWRCVVDEGGIWASEELRSEHACEARHPDAFSLTSDETGVHCRPR